MIIPVALKDNLYQIVSRQIYLNCPSTACFQNLKNADVLILSIRALTPATTFSKVLGKISQKMVLTFYLSWWLDRR